MVMTKNGVTTTSAAAYILADLDQTEGHLNSDHVDYVLSRLEWKHLRPWKHLAGMQLSCLDIRLSIGIHCVIQILK